MGILLFVCLVGCLVGWLVRLSPGLWVKRLNGRQDQEISHDQTWKLQSISLQTFTNFMSTNVYSCLLMSTNVYWCLQSPPRDVVYLQSISERRLRIHIALSPFDLRSLFVRPSFILRSSFVRPSFDLRSGFVREARTNEDKTKKQQKNKKLKTSKSKTQWQC